MTQRDMGSIRAKLGDHHNAQAVWDYVTGCLDGTILACPDIRQACERFLADLDDPRWDFRPAEAEYAIELIETMLCHQQGQRLDATPLRGQPFLLLPYHKFCVYNLLGFYLAGTDERRFKEAFIFVPRKNIKTTFAAALAWALSLIESPSGSKVYIVSAALKQSLESFGFLAYNVRRLGLSQDDDPNGLRILDNNAERSISGSVGEGSIYINALASNPDQQDSFNANTTSTFLNIPASAVGLAVLTVVGQCLGAGEKEQAVWYARRLLLLAYAGAWIMNLSAFFFADKLALTLFHLSPEAQAMALQVMQWFNLFSIFFWPSSFTLPNILRAAGDASFTMSISIVSMWVFRVGFCYLMVLCFHGQLLSIWMGMFLDWVFRSVCFMVRFVRGKWLEQHVI